MNRRPTIGLITGGLVEGNLRLQPWRYLSEVALQLAAQGYQVTLISDGDSPASLRDKPGLAWQTVSSVSCPRWWVNRELQQAIVQSKPEMILWHVGLTSFLHQRLETGGQMPLVGIFTSPIYTWSELKRVGLKKLITGYQLSAVHLLGALTPRRLLRQFELKNRQMQRLVTQTQTTRQRLIKAALWSKPIEVIGPGVDEVWRQPALSGRDKIRARLGYGDTDKVVVYFGSPTPLRGLNTLIRAFNLARPTHPQLKLLILSRRRADELRREDAGLKRLLNDPSLEGAAQVVSGYLTPAELARHIAAADVVALPFEMVPSDAPLSVLEAQALGKPVVTTRVACLPELAGENYLAHPGDPVSLAEALAQAARANFTDFGTPPSLAVRDWQEMGAEWSRFIESL